MRHDQFEDIRRTSVRDGPPPIVRQGVPATTGGGACSEGPDTAGELDVASAEAMCVVYASRRNNEGGSDGIHSGSGPSRWIRRIQRDLSRGDGLLPRDAIRVAAATRALGFTAVSWPAAGSHRERRASALEVCPIEGWQRRNRPHLAYGMCLTCGWPLERMWLHPWFPIPSWGGRDRGV